MYDELYAWIESFVGVSLDPYDTLPQTNDIAFVDPFSWKCGLSTSLDNLLEFMNTMEEHRQEAPDSLGDVELLKMEFARNAIGEILEKVNSIKMKLNIEITRIKGLEGLRSNIDLVTNLIEFCKENTIDKITNPMKFDEFNDSNDGDLEKVLGISQKDIMNIHQAVSDYSEMFTPDDDEE